MMKSNKVADLINKRQEIDKEIEDIQKGCPHFNRYVCDKCSLIIGIPNNDELQNYLKQ